MLLPLAGCGVGAPARPGPHNVGAVGPSAPPARSAALRPALPARPRLRRRPCRAALPTHLPPGIAAPRGSRWPACGPRQAAPRALAPLRAASSLRAFGACSARAVRGPQFRPPRALAAQALPSPRFARGGAQGTPPAGGNASRGNGWQGQGKPRAGRQAAHKRGPCLPCPRPAMGKRGGCPALCGPPAPSHSGKRWCFLCLLLLVVCLAPVMSGGWSADLAVSLAGLSPGLPGLSGRPLWRRRLPVSWRRSLRPGLFGLLVQLLAVWRWCVSPITRSNKWAFCRKMMLQHNTLIQHYQQKPHRISHPVGLF